MVKIQELSATLIDKYGLGKEDAELFVTQMFILIADELHASQTSVKVKGLGTFKVTSVNSRESVDVNSGERIVINGHNRITFTPDVVLRDRVNRPFAQFETVVVNDGVDFSEIDGKDADNLTDAECQETESAGNEEAETEIMQEQHPQDGEPCLANETAAVEAEDNITEPLQNEDGIPGGFLHIKCMKFCCLSALAAVALCCACFGFYYLYGQLQLRNQRITILEKEVKQAVTANQKANENPTLMDSFKTVNTGETLVNAKAGNESIQSPAVHTAGKEAAIDYESDPRLRTGAYIIIGVDTTVVVRKGQTLASISKAYLGPSMECYVEALNSYRTVSAGDSLKIPKLKLKKRIR